MKKLYNKLIKSLEKKPKLLKFINFIRYLIEAFCIVWTIITIIALAVGSSYSNEANNYIDNKTSNTKNAVLKQDYQLYNLNEFLNNDFLNALLEYEFERSGYSDYISIGELLYYGPGSHQTCYAGVGNGTYIFGYVLLNSELAPNSMPNYDDVTRAIKTIDIKNVQMVTDTSTSYGRWRKYEFYMTYSDYLGNPIRIVPFNVSCTYDNNLTLLSYFVNGLDIEQYVLVNHNVTDLLGSNLLLDLYQSDQVAYQTGYNIGYAKGQSSVAEQNDGVFSLLRQAFQSVAYVFNINILPGFTLGTLITLPIVVFVIIILFRMFRG